MMKLNSYLDNSTTVRHNQLKKSTIVRIYSRLFAASQLQQVKIANWRKAMPLVNVKLIEGVFTSTQKQEMIRKLTDTMVSIEGENMRPVTWVVIEEVKSGDWGIGGNPLTTHDVHQLAAGKPTVNA
jgi:4-oxalocrotonate tautomerase